MAGLNLITFAVLALAIGGLAAVLWEILAKNPRSLIEMATDSRRFAEAPLAGEGTPQGRRSVNTSRIPANQNESRLAA
jgi:hypothetical protein